MIGLIFQSVGAAILLSLPFLAVGVRATLDLRRDRGRRYRTSPARPRTRAARRSGPAGAGEWTRSPRPVNVDGRGAPASPTTALVGLHRERRHG